MKKNLYIFFLFLSFGSYGQITTPLINANFGVDGDLDANYFLNSISPTGGDDWFIEYPGTGIGVIDTTGAAAIVAGYSSNPALLNTTFGRGMNVIPGTIVNNKLLINSIFVRDYHSPDSTMFASGSSKNGMSPANWNTAVPQSIPNKNDILDVMAHMRRDGTASHDSLWLFGGVSIESTSGDRYFDFELYQTDISYNLNTQKFSGYGPDAGHTSWIFDGSGNVTKAGDVIFSASYGSSTLSSIEARIWIDSASLSITPKSFKWSGTFDGGGTQFGYAGIIPNTAGAFYTGLENTAPTWAGPFSLVTASNSVVPSYATGQFMEFSVNMTKLGLDPYALLANIGCGLSIKRLMVKSRASTSFSAQLKDFVGPINFFQDFNAKVQADTSSFCGIVGPTTLKVTNPIPEFVYTWSTTNGHIVSNFGSSIVVDSAGTYLLSEAIYNGCKAFDTTSVIVSPFNINCKTLEVNLTNFDGELVNGNAQLQWSVSGNGEVNYFEIESSTDGVQFSLVGKVYSQSSDLPVVNYNYTDNALKIGNGYVYYRIKIIGTTNKVSYSKIIKLRINGNSNDIVKILPNPVQDFAQIAIFSEIETKAQLNIYDETGRLMRRVNIVLQNGNSIVQLSDFSAWSNGIYIIKINLGNELYIKRMVLDK